MVNFSDIGIASVEHGIILCHCNGQKIYNVGATGLIRAKYPDLITPYKEMLWAYEKEPDELLGKFATYRANEDLIICLAVGQHTVSGPEGNTSTKAYKKILNKIRMQMDTQRIIQKTGDPKQSLTLELHIPDTLGDEGGTVFKTDILPLIEAEFEGSKTPVFIHKT